MFEVNGQLTAERKAHIEREVFDSMCDAHTIEMADAYWPQFMEWVHSHKGYESVSEQTVREVIDEMREAQHG